MTPFEELCDSIKRSVPDIYSVSISYKNTGGISEIRIPRVHFPEEECDTKPAKLIPSLRHSVNNFAETSLKKYFPDWEKYVDLSCLLHLNSSNTQSQENEGYDEDIENNDEFGDFNQGTERIEDRSNLDVIVKGKIIIDLYTETAHIQHVSFTSLHPALEIRDIDVSKWPGV